MVSSPRSRLSGLFSWVALGLASAAAVFVPSPVEAGGSEVDLRDGADVVIVGAHERDRVVGSTAAGDVNGDDVADVLITSCVRHLSRGDSGATFVVFGGPGRGTIPLDGTQDDYGFRIEGIDTQYSCEAEGVGDVNGDGLDDIAVGASGADNRGRANSGSVYIVFGKQTRTTVDLGLFDLGVQRDLGFRIDGPGPIAFAGWDIGSAGDMDGDGLGDILVGAPWAGSSYVVFGKAAPEAVDLATFHRSDVADGLRISHPAPEDPASFGVAGLGDVNRDAIPDIGIGLSPREDHAGVVYVVFGQRRGGNIDARRLKSRGYRITGARPFDTAGHGLASAGDINADGFADAIVGSPRLYQKDGRGNAYVVFGGRQTASVHLGDLGRRGFRIRGLHASDSTGIAVAGAGDVDGDGLDDVIVGAPGARFADRGSREFGDQPGAAFVVYGKRSTRMIRLGELGARGYRVKGAEGKPDRCEDGVSHPTTGPIIGYFCEGDLAGASVAPAGDWNGDGLADVLVSAPFAGDPYPGHSYVIWSHPRR